MSADDVAPQISEETRSKRAPWIMFGVILLGAALFVLISNPGLAMMLSGTGR